MIIDPTEQPGALGRQWQFDPNDPQHGDWVGQFELFDRAYRPGLLRFVRRVAKDRWLADSDLDAEAVVNVTMTRAALRWPTLDRPARWIYTVASNMVREAFRNRHRRREITAIMPGWTSGMARAPVTEVDLADAPAADHVEDEVLDRLDPGPAYAALGDLPVQQRIATYLFDVQRWRAREIAELLGCAESTVPVHVRRGRGQLRDMLDRLNGAAYNLGFVVLFAFANQFAPEVARALHAVFGVEADSHDVRIWLRVLATVGFTTVSLLSERRRRRHPRLRGLPTQRRRPTRR